MNYSRAPWRRNNLQIVDAQDEPIALVSSRWSGLPEQYCYEKALESARLIAAAPDLQTALTTCLDLMEQVSTQIEQDQTWREALHTAYVALTKARAGER